MRVVLDANVYVSSMVNTKGKPNRIISAWQQGAFDVLISRPILDEIGSVLRFPGIVKRHQQDEATIQRFVKRLGDEAIVVEPTDRLDVIRDDESDNRYLECAIVGKAQYVVSGDNHLLTVGEFKGILILSPAAFVVLLGSGGIT